VKEINRYTKKNPARRSYPSEPDQKKTQECAKEEEKKESDVKIFYVYLLLR